jgi:hypothetical protein
VSFSSSSLDPRQKSEGRSRRNCLGNCGLGWMDLMSLFVQGAWLFLISSSSFPTTFQVIHHEPDFCFL